MRINLLILVLGACAGRTSPASLPEPLPAPMAAIGATGDLQRLSWLSGSWSSEDEAPFTEEHWTAPSTNLVLGINRVTSQGFTKHHEQLRIEKRPEGIYFVASPSGQETTAFRLIEQGENYAVFENAAHDYPKRITYRRMGDSLAVRIEGEPGVQVAEWSWRQTILPYE